MKKPQPPKEGVDFELVPVKGPLLVVRMLKGPYAGLGFYYEYIKFFDQDGNELKEDSNPTSAVLSFEYTVLENPKQVDVKDKTLADTIGEILTVVLESALVANEPNYTVYAYGSNTANPIIET